MTPIVLVVMGVSGSGKSTVADRLAKMLDLQYVDADDLHPRENVAKMAAGSPLTDNDRWPWLDAVGASLKHHQGSGAGTAMACSALKRDYRDRIRASVPDALFVQLVGDKALLESRMQAREGHFMPTELLDGQLATLQSLDTEERGVTVSITGSTDEVAERALQQLRHAYPDKIPAPPSDPPTAHR